MRINTTRFGEIEIDEERISQFPLGLPGFDAEKAFVLVELEANSPFYFLQSTTSPELAFMVTEPRMFFPDYELHVSAEVLAFLNTDKEEDLHVLVMLSIPENFRNTTANLLAPIIINNKTNRALQSIPPQSPYHTKHPIFPPQRGSEKETQESQAG